MQGDVEVEIGVTPYWTQFLSNDILAKSKQYDRKNHATRKIDAVIKRWGCYDLSTNSKTLPIQHTISVQTETHGSFKIDDFSLLKYSKLYMSAYIIGLYKLYLLQLTKASINILTAL